MGVRVGSRVVRMMRVGVRPLHGVYLLRVVRMVELMVWVVLRCWRVSGPCTVTARRHSTLIPSILILSNDIHSVICRRLDGKTRSSSAGLCHTATNTAMMHCLLMLVMVVMMMVMLMPLLCVMPSAVCSSRTHPLLRLSILLLLLLLLVLLLLVLLLLQLLLLLLL